MVIPNLSAFCLRTLAVAGCGMALTLSAALSGRQALPGHVPPLVRGLKPVGALAETNHLRLALGLSLRHQAELTTLLRDLYNPTSPKFHQYLKPAEFASRFGPTEEDYAAVRGFAKSHGLHVVQTHANRLLLDVEGSVADVKEAFHINLNVFKHPTEDRTFYAPENEPSVEGNLPLLHVAGLDNYLLPKTNLRVRGGSVHGPWQTGSGPDGAYMGQDFRTAYAPGVTLNGAGQTVAVVEFDTFTNSDIEAYESLAKLPNVPVTPVPIDGFNSPPSGSDGQVEVSLDIEMAIAMAPGLSQVLVYEAYYGDTSVNDDLLNQIAIDDLANQISCCWTITIDPTSDLIFQEMAVQGQSFYNASGDYGAYYWDVFPQMSDPYITEVGGTTLTTSGAGGPYSSETVWNWFTTSEGAAASSGGISSYYSIPYWQQSVNMSANLGSSTARNLPDVSMTGDNVFAYVAGSEFTLGGTSCAAPLWAGFTALINQQAVQNGLPPVGFLNPSIYAAAQSALYPSLFHDITKGNNTNYNGTTEFFAVPGYDLCTGWGTPKGQALINALAPPDNLLVKAEGGLTFAVAFGYPLSGRSQTLVLKNPGSSNIDWAFGPLPSWLGVSVSSGAISPGVAAFVTMSPNDSATNLAPGNYVTDLLLTNETAGVTHVIPVFLNAFDPLLITPDAGLDVFGPPGSTFDQLSQTYILTNFASVPMEWTAQSTSSLINLSPTNGTLPAGASVNVVATPAPQTSNILISVQAGNLLFTDLYSTNTQILPFNLDVGNGGFETGDSSDWTLSGTDPTSYNGVVGSQTYIFVDYIHSGEYAMVLGEPDALASLTQTLPTVSNQSYLVSLFLNNPFGGFPNQFEVNWGGATLYNQVDLGQMEWTHLQFTAMASNSSTSLQLLFRNDSDYFGLDDISVVPVLPPIFNSATVSNNFVILNWNAIPGLSYQVKTSTDLISWIKSGNAILATKTIMTAKEPLILGNPQKFFELELESP